MTLPRAKKRPVRAIFLVGFMGAGKSSVGRALSLSLNCSFEDLDERIECTENRSVAEIFSESGEAEFRRIERESLRRLMQEISEDETRVVGLGGGTFIQPENALLLDGAGILTVFLDAPVEELWQRCRKQAEAHGSERPLLQSLKQFRSLYESRHASYRRASMQVATGGRSIASIAREIADAAGIKSPPRGKKEGLFQ